MRSESLNELRKLDVSQNDLSDLPYELGYLENLERRGNTARVPVFQLVQKGPRLSGPFRAHPFFGAPLPENDQPLVGLIPILLTITPLCMKLYDLSHTHL